MHARAQIGGNVSESGGRQGNGWEVPGGGGEGKLAMAGSSMERRDLQQGGEKRPKGTKGGVKEEVEEEEQQQQEEEGSGR